ncbi:MAG: trypsin-like serine protease [Nanoarchaeota archaeon]|nr:trypsin-like serine protease [Nanoarchaeota archaeon]
MILGTSQTGLESILALEKAMKDYESQELTKQESEKNISDNLIIVNSSSRELKKLSNGKFGIEDESSGTGLLLTTDGFILTAYHNIESYIDDWHNINHGMPKDKITTGTLNFIFDRYYIIDQQRNSYPIDITTYAFMPEYDIALIKAINFKKPEPIKFKILKKELEVNNAIKLFGIRNGTPYNQYGKIIKTKHNARMINNDGKLVTDTYLTDAYSVPGFSGGAFTTTNGELAGIATYGSFKNNEEIGHAGGAKIQNIFQLLQSNLKYINTKTIHIIR